MSPKRGDRAAPPPKAGEYEIRFADNQVADGWEQLCAQAVGNTRRAGEAIVADPRPKPPSERHHRLKHALATRALTGADQGFDLVEERTERDGTVRMVLRRVS